ncbi:MAG TPA: GNAT family N-acetyltransferase [Terracidiphilus sp.]|nr:GNAT family N-acetyltransferase [Terracidiphilus sp.]
MATTATIQILDLRHFGAPMLRPVLEVESELWMQRLHWDYRASSRLLMQYLDNHMLPGYAALDAGAVTGYTFCVYEQTKAVIGDVFATRALAPGEDAGDPPAQAVEETLLTHLFETLLNSPQLDRIESQLLLHPAGTHANAFRDAGFQLFRRLFMVLSLSGSPPRAQADLPPELEMRPWREEDLNPSARLISMAYADHPDSRINDQYHSIHGSTRFLNNIVRYSGCGVFASQASHVIVHRITRELAGLVLASRVSPQSGHITQLCIHPEYRRQGMARRLLAAAAAQFLRMNIREISLTVTEDNRDAVTLYRSEGYRTQHTFDAAVWQRGSKRFQS